jgi:hypothetical protein
MNSALNEFRSRQIVQTMNRMRDQVDLFATHARVLRMSSKSLDSSPLLEEADRLLLGLKSSRAEFEEAAAQTRSISRGLSSPFPAAGGMPPAAKWGNEFRAGGRQFGEAVRRAEKELSGLYAAANEKLNSPTRTPTGAPENLFDIFINFVDGLSRWVEYRRSHR